MDAPSGVVSLQAQGPREPVPPGAEWEGGAGAGGVPCLLGPQDRWGPRLVLAEQMDELLQRCFLHALKSRVRKADLPLLTSTFLGSHVLSCWYMGHGAGVGARRRPLSYPLVTGQARAGRGIGGGACCGESGEEG